MKCTLCHFRCGVDRSRQTGHCGIDDRIHISHYGLHTGEEPFLTGKYGSGTIFFAGCSLRCRFCQNYQISRWTVADGFSKIQTISVKRLVEIFRELESKGAPNINFVSPTPYAHHIREAILEARSAGFSLPFVYNTHGYDSLETIEFLNGLMDIYLPDLKYGNDEIGKLFSSAPHIYSFGRSVIQAMYDQVGLLQLDQRGLAVKGIAVRHLVIPGHIESSFEVLECLEKINRRIHISLMSQFHPCPENSDPVYPELNRTLSREEYESVVHYAYALGFKNLLLQEMKSHESHLPDFDDDLVFKD